LQVVPTWGQRRREAHGRWYRPRGANMLVWAAVFLVDRMAPVPSLSIKEQPAAPLPEGLASALARFGHAIADKKGLPGGAAAAG